MDMGVLTVIFNVQSWKMHKKFAKNIFGGYDKTQTSL